MFVVFTVGLIGRATKGLPFDLALFGALAKFLICTTIIAALVTVYLKSWGLKYNRTEIVESYSLLGWTKSSSYRVSELRAIICQHNDPTMLGIPFDTLIFDFGRSRLMLRMGNWTRESLKRCVSDLISYRPTVPVQQPVLDFVTGEYDRIFYDASDPLPSNGYAQRPDP